MTSRGKVIWANLGGLGMLVAVAIFAFVAMRGPLGARVYARNLREGSAAERMQAAIALQSYGSQGTPAIPSLVEVLQNPDNAAAPASARALREIDPETAYEYV